MSDSQSLISAPPDGSRIRYGVDIETSFVRTRDGIALATDVYRPAKQGVPALGTYPSILERTPYDRTRTDFHKTGIYFASRGYAYIVQDCRGRYDSEGEFTFFTGEGNQEGDDGFDTIKWIDAQQWGNGRVGTTGQSYGALTQQALAVTRPASLAAQVHIEGPFNFWRREIRESGAFGGGFFLPWVINMALTSREARQERRVQLELRKMLSDLPDWVRHPLKRGSSPLAQVPKYESWYLALATSSDYSAFWKNPASSIEEHLDTYPDVPTFLIASWYGIDAWGNFEKFTRIGERARGRTRILCGPWVHDIGFGENSMAGEVEFGRAAALSINDEQLRWFDYWLKDLDSGVAAEPPIRVFVMGSATGGGLTPDLGRLIHGGNWRYESHWPPADSQNTTLYLHSDNSLRSTLPPPGSPPTVYTFDPSSPVPTIGGAPTDVPGNWSATNSSGGRSRILDAGPYDQRGRLDLAFCDDTLPLDARADLIAFRTDVLEDAVEVTGDVEIHLWVMTDCRDTDFTARLIDEYPPSDDHPSGFAMNLVDCIVRLRYRNGVELADLPQPNTVYEVTLERKSTSNVFARGHRIRLDLSSSNFPLWDVNPNSGGPLGSPADLIRARNTIFHDASRPSCIKLPTCTVREP